MKQRKNAAPDVLGGGWLNKILSRHWGIALLVCALVMVGMWQNFYYQQQLLGEVRMQRSVEEEEHRALVIRATMYRRTRSTAIKAEAEHQGLKMSANPPKKVKVIQNDDKNR